AEGGDPGGGGRPGPRGPAGGRRPRGGRAALPGEGGRRTGGKRSGGGKGGGRTRRRRGCSARPSPARAGRPPRNEWNARRPRGRTPPDRRAARNEPRRGCERPRVARLPLGSSRTTPPRCERSREPAAPPGPGRALRTTSIKNYELEFT